MTKKKNILKDKDMFPGFVDIKVKPNPTHTKQGKKNSEKLSKQNITWCNPHR